MLSHARLYLATSFFFWVYFGELWFLVEIRLIFSKKLEYFAIISKPTIFDRKNKNKNKKHCIGS
jgi:hypothetical protein